MTRETAPRVGFAVAAERLRDAVATVAAADPGDPADPYRGLYVTDAAAGELASERPPAGAQERLAEVAALLGLDEIGAAVLDLVAAPDVSPSYGRIVGYLHDDLARRFLTPRLLVELLDADGFDEAHVLARLARTAPLRALGAIEMVPSVEPTPLGERMVRVADRLAAFILGAPLDDAAAAGSAVPVEVPLHPVGRAATRDEIAARLRAGDRHLLAVAGPDADVVLAAALGEPLLVADVAHLERPALMDAILWSVLERRHLCFTGLEDLEPSRTRRAALAAATTPRRAVVLARHAGVSVALDAIPHSVVPVPPLDLAERRELWQAVLPGAPSEETAAKFRLSATQLAEAAATAAVAAELRGAAGPGRHDVDLGAREASSGGLGELAHRLDAPFCWDDLVLAERPTALLRSVEGQLRHRDLVLAEWGYDRTVARKQGIKILFAGDSGTGKTMAAQVLAHELGLAIYLINIATMVSKYIGETEKNLDRVFAAAEGSNAVLFFDEADALFGKRSAVSDAHDRYANIEVAYLLQKMEAYEGAVILATNFRSNIDQAFLRRLDVVVDFPFPEAGDRERIWTGVLPVEAPRDDDIDLRFLAERFRLSGGNIRNASLAAAFMAAEEGTAIGMRHLVRGVALEYGKLGRLTLEADFAHYLDEVR